MHQARGLPGPKKVPAASIGICGTDGGGERRVPWLGSLVGV
jgi:hypothetical protein